MDVLDEEQQRLGAPERLEGGVDGGEEVGAVEVRVLRRLVGWPVAGRSKRSTSGGADGDGRTRRAGIRRAIAGAASTSDWASAGDSVARRPKASLNGR